MRGVGALVVLLALAVTGCGITFGAPQESGDRGAASEPDNAPVPEPPKAPKPDPVPTEPTRLKTQKIANQFADLLAEEVQGSVTVKCPKAVPFKVGRGFDCKASGDVTGPIHVTIKNDKGKVDANFDDLTAG